MTKLTLSTSVAIRLTALACLLFFELMSISLNFDAYLPQLSETGEWFAFLAYAGQFAKVIVVIIAAAFLAIWSRIPQHIDTLKNALDQYRFFNYISFQLIAFAIFYYCTALIFGSHNGSTVIITIWFIALFAVAAFWLLSVAPASYWRIFLSTEKKALLASLLLGIFAWWIAKSSQNLWGPLSDLTFLTSTLFLNLVYSEIFANPELKILGTSDFLVNIAPSCSGYEGIGLVVIFTSFYLFIYKKEFRFPNALLLFPIGILTIWLFNAIRIALLIIIGSSFSPEIALGGFHSQAGWISFIIVIFSLLMAAHKLPFFYLQKISSHPSITAIPNSTSNLATALLIPFIVLLASIIVTSSFSADFNWLYPLRVIAVAAALFICWKTYAISRFKLRVEPVLAGIVVFIIWILIIPNSPEQNNIFNNILFSAPTSISTTWLIFRFVGAVVTVPLAEELLFRGYLFSRLTKQKINLNEAITLSWPALLLSSILFGLLHSSLIAGTLAGLIYGLVRYRSSSILDAVIAHSTTNLLLSILVLSTGHWSLW